MELSGYFIKEEIYDGELFLVCRALRKSDNKPVILKILKGDYPTLEQLARFRGEYEIGKSFQSDGVLAVYALEQHKNSLFLAFEDFEGQSLKSYLASNKLDLITFLRLAILTTEVLSEIHEHSIIHKDINSSNILLNPKTKKIKIIDFGLATFLPKERFEVRNPRALESTLLYMSPEQTGRMNRGIDYRTDYYSLGVTFYEMLTNHLPFQSDDPMEIVHSHLAKTPKSPHEIDSNIPKPISDIVMKCLEKTPEKRYQNAFGLKYDLQKCLDQLQQLGKIEPFEIGTKDISSRFQIPEKLYGRDEEVRLLLSIFERAAFGPTELMLITGDAGIGKSALVQEIQKPITQKRGYFAYGKFNQLTRNIPYFSFIQAIQGLIRKIVSESQEEVTLWKEHLLKVLGANGKLVTDIIPELISIIGPQPDVPEIGPTESQNRFLIVFHNFVSSLASQDSPLAIFLDDLQWADLPSLKLLENLLTQTESRHIFIIGGYRDREVDSTHPLTATINEIQKKKIPINFIKIEPLKLSDVEQLVADTLHCSTTTSAALAKLCYDKTQGNPFFLNQFLNTLYQDSLITFSTKTGAWWWDIEEIKKQSITDNVVELMTKKLNKLPLTTQKIVELASCIGSQFDLKTLALAAEKSLKQASDELWKALEEGLVIPLDENYKFVENLPDINVNYKFLHDRVQQAAYSLLSEENKKQIHLNIGRLLLKSTSKEKQSEILFSIVGHLNLAIDLIDTEKEKKFVAEFNLMCAKKARASAAYDIALNHITVAIKLLGADAWQNHYKLMLDLQTEYAESAYLNGNFSQMNESIEEVLKNAKNVLDEVRAHIVKVAYYVATEQPQKAAETAFPVLTRLGVNFPKHPNVFHVAITFLHSQILIMTKTPEDLKNLPPMTNPYKLAAMQLLMIFMVAVYIYVPKLVPILLLRILILSIKYGNSLLSSTSYAGHGIFLAGFLYKIDKGFEFAELAFYLVEKYNQKTVKPIVWVGANFCIAHWKVHLKEVAKSLLDGYHVALENGDLVYSGAASNVYCVCEFLYAKELNEVLADMQKYASLSLKAKQKIHYNALSVHSQCIANLLEKKDDPIKLSGQYFNEETADLINDVHLIFVVCFDKMILAYLFGEYEQALENASAARKWAVESTPFVANINLYESLACLGAFANAGSIRRKWLLRKVKNNQNKLRLWSEHGPMNYLHKYYLVEAERHRILRQYQLAETFYEKSIKSASENGYSQDEALANELASHFHLECGNEKIAKLYLTDAHYCYKKWGAQAKVLQLEEKYPWLKAMSKPHQKIYSTLSTQASSYATIADTLDLGTVLKASQAISTELELPKLIEKMLRILVENLGAQRGILILEQNQQLAIAGEYIISKEENNHLKMKQLSEDSIPISIIQYVHRSKEVVLLEGTESQFNFDPYIVNKKPKSILCAPVLSHNRVVGIVYFENNLITSAFAPDHLEILSMLSGQIAVSIENAKFYESSQRFVPKQFLELLGKESLVEVKLGDYTQKTLTVMFVDIREFTRISESNDPKFIFSIINEYLGGMEPIITKHGGLIDKYIGDTIVILFVKNADDALNTGIEIQAWLRTFNATRQETFAINVGIGINTGLAMIGTIGSERRMDGTVLSDAINTASRIEGLNKIYGTQMLITENTADSLINLASYNFRYIDKVRVMGKTQALRVLEVLDALPEDQKKLKLAILEDFNKARELYLARKFEDAKLIFTNCLKTDPSDQVSKLYMTRCENFIYSGCPPEWDGTIDFTTK